MRANEDIRRAAGGAGVRIWQIAEKFGVTDSYFSRKLRKEFSAEERAKAMRFIDELRDDRG